MHHIGYLNLNHQPSQPSFRRKPEPLSRFSCHCDVCLAGSLNPQVSSYKSRQVGFIFSINTIFQPRNHSLICFSRRIAAGIVSMHLIVDEMMHAIPLRETLEQILLVL